MKPSFDREPISVQCAGLLLALLGVGFLLMGLMLSVGGLFSGPHVLFPGLVLLVFSYGMIGGVSRLNRKAAGCVRFAVVWSLGVAVLFGVVSLLVLLDADQFAIVGSMVYGSVAGLAVLIVACLKTRSATAWLEGTQATFGTCDEVLNADLR